MADEIIFKPLLSRDAILASKRPRAEAFVSAFGGNVKVMELSAPERVAFDVWRAKLATDRGAEFAQKMFTVAWVIQCTANGDGKRVFTDADLDTVADLPPADIRRVYRVAARLNGLMEEEEEPDENP